MTTIDLADGRLLDIQVTGPADGVPLLFHHGTPGAVTQFGAIQRAAHERNLRLVTFSRPGFGGSSRKPGRTVADVVGDTEAVLDHLGAPRCVVAGWSGGGPHALATGARLADRVAGVLSIAGIAPYGVEGLDFMAGMGEENVVEFGHALEGETPLTDYLKQVAAELQDPNPEQIVTALATLLPDVDRAVLTDEFGADMAASFREAMRTGVDGWLDDDLAFTEHWGFDLDEISVPTFLWQGSADLMVPFTHGEWLATRIPGVTAHLLDGEGHLSVGVGALESMLDELATTL